MLAKEVSVPLLKTESHRSVQESRLKICCGGQVWEHDSIHGVPHSIRVFGVKGESQHHDHDVVGDSGNTKAHNFCCEA